MLRWLVALALAIAAAGAARADEDCSAATVARTRGAFQQAYDLKDFTVASRILEPLWARCTTQKGVPAVIVAALNSDYAVLAHRQGDDEACLQALLDYMPVTRTPAPELARLPPELQRAIRFNFAQCRKYCEGAPLTDPSCDSIRISLQAQQTVSGRFAEKPCTFDTGGSPTLALPGGACIAVFAPAPWHYAEGEEQDPAQQDPEKACPRFTLARRAADGKVSLSPLAVPEKSFTRDVGLCCAALDLAIGPDGRIEMTPSDNPPEHCLSGHRADILQDLFRLKGDALVLLHQYPAR
ncbi:MAG TPA: hypothetical protein VGG57_21780 [Stellaceae bacterium]|jgi:hypothetical protein